MSRNQSILYLALINPIQIEEWWKEHTIITYLLISSPGNKKHIFFLEPTLFCYHNSILKTFL